MGTMNKIKAETKEARSQTTRDADIGKIKKENWYTRPMTSSGRFHTSQFRRLISSTANTGMARHSYWSCHKTVYKNLLIIKNQKRKVCVYPSVSTYPWGK